MKKAPLALVLFAAVALMSGTSATAVPLYSVIPLGSFGHAGSFPWAINNNGQIVGDSANESFQSHAFLYDAGSLTDLGTLGGTWSYARAINDNGAIVGYSATSGGSSGAAFLYSGSGMTNLGLGIHSVANGINDSGQIVGSGSSGGSFLLENGTMHFGMFSGGSAWAINNHGDVAGHATMSNGQHHAALYSNGITTDLGVLGSDRQSAAWSINDNGKIVGASGEAYRTRAFLYANGSMVELSGLIGSGSTLAFDINNKDQIVGYSWLPSINQQHAVLWESSFAIDLNDFLDVDATNSGFEILSATSINDLGWIVGVGSGRTYSGGVLLIPTAVPLPAAVMLLAPALGGLGFMRRRAS